MTTAEMILKEMETPEGQEKMKKWIEEYKSKVDAKNKKMHQIFSDTNYLIWLEKFTLEHPSFSSNDWLYFPEQISKEDNEKVDNLCLLFEGIELYADKNYIYPTECDFGSYYNIKLNNIGFEVGVLVGQGTLFFCNRVEVENEKGFIDFMNIINNKQSDNAVIIKNKLNHLSNSIVSLYKEGVPFEAISITLENALNEIKTQKDLEQGKVLKKK